MKTIASLITLSLLCLVAGCNTFRGVGQDVQRAGSAIEDAAKKK